MKRRVFGGRSALLRLAVVACSLAVFALGAFDHGAAVEPPVSIEVIEAVGVTDSQQALPPASAGVNEGVGVADAVALVPPASIEINESVLVADSQQAVPPASVDASEGVQVSDAVLVLPPASIVVNEAIGVNDGQELVPPASIVVNEAITVSDTQMLVPPAVIQVSEAIGVSDALGDSDGDGAADLTDNCAATSNANQADGDADGVGNVCDNCPATANGPGQRFVLGAGYQTDSDSDGLPGTQPPFDGIFGGDACDVDDDNDGVADVYDVFCRTLPEDYDGFQDNDGCPDPDNDLDGVLDVADVGRSAFYPAGHNHGDPPDVSCRNVAEDHDGFHDSDGCPEPDNDNDSHLDASDSCAGGDHAAGPDGAFGAPQDFDHDGVKDAAEATFTSDDLLQVNEDFDGVLDADGCHDSPGNDFDGDGYTDDDEALFIGTDPGYPCGINGWPSNLNDGGFSANRLDILDVTSMVAPVRHYEQSPGDPGFDARWDIKPGPTGFPKYINILDVTTLVAGTTGNPPMLNGGRAFGRDCPLPPQ